MVKVERLHMINSTLSQSGRERSGAAELLLQYCSGLEHTVVELEYVPHTEVLVLSRFPRATYPRETRIDELELEKNDNAE